nr:immunoglobulin heavy chain junction region [Macaca mulatta]MOW99418.1 immunoglobulin heavy chain junction region [Macaca mulatta]MOX01159.1 immunoglobulin heavy chain junction region [Macaca mulatta]MOX01364.1 immunoglobulin heavy chain junction region [Macaca mulatta]MOX02653.1 immunoglobulin heavy chain junction region [Macaca mulatta]
CARGGEYFEFW